MIHNGNLFDSTSPKQQYKIKDGECVGVDIMSVHFDFYKKLFHPLHNYILILQCTGVLAFHSVGGIVERDGFCSCDDFGFE